MDASVSGAGDSSAHADNEAAPPEPKRPRVSPGELSWRNDFCADWKVRVGEKTYEVHAFTLARVSQFFESHISIVTRTGGTGSVAVSGLCAATRTSDLTDVLPIPCHAAFDSVLDFAYSRNEDSCQLPATKAIHLLKIADILAMDKLAERAEGLCQGVSADVALSLLGQYGEFHIPGTRESERLGSVSANLAKLVARRFQPLSVDVAVKFVMFRLPVSSVVEVLKADELLVASENDVVMFVRQLIETRNRSEQTAGDRAETMAAADKLADCDQASLWNSVRWAFVTHSVFDWILKGPLSSMPSVAIDIACRRSNQLELGEAAIQCDVQRQPIRPPHVAPPSITDVDMCIYCPPGHQKGTFHTLVQQICDLRYSFAVTFEDPIGQRGLVCVSVVPMSKEHEATSWQIDQVSVSFAFFGWTEGVEKIFKQTVPMRSKRLEIFPHVFGASEELQRYLSPDGFLFVRFALGDKKTSLSEFQLQRR